MHAISVKILIDYATIVYLMRRAGCFYFIFLMISSAACASPYLETGRRVLFSLSAGFAVGSKHIKTSVNLQTLYTADFFVGPSGQNLFSGSFNTDPVYTERGSLAPVQTNTAYPGLRNHPISESDIVNLYVSGLKKEVYLWRGVDGAGTQAPLRVRKEDMLKAFFHNNDATVPQDRGYIARTLYGVMTSHTNDEFANIQNLYVMVGVGYRFSPFFSAFFKGRVIGDLAPFEQVSEGVDFEANSKDMKEAKYSTLSGQTKSIPALPILPFAYSHSKTARDMKISINTQDTFAFLFEGALSPPRKPISLNFYFGLQRTVVNVTAESGQLAFPMVISSYSASYLRENLSSLWVGMEPLRFKEVLWPVILGLGMSLKRKRVSVTVGLEYMTAEGDIAANTVDRSDTDDPEDTAKKQMEIFVPFNGRMPSQFSDVQDAQGVHMGLAGSDKSPPGMVRAVASTHCDISGLSFVLEFTLTL